MIYDAHWPDVGGCVTADDTTWVDLLEVPAEVLAYPGAVFIGSLRILAYIDDGSGAPDKATQLRDFFTVTTPYSGSGITDMYIASSLENVVLATPVALFGGGAGFASLQIVAAGATAMVQVKGIAATTIRWAAIADVIGDNHP